MQCTLYFLDGVLVAGDFAQMLDARLRRMGVGIVETRKHGLEGKVDLARAGGGQRQHVSVRAYSEKSSAADGHGLSSRLGWIHGPDVSVVENDFRLFRAHERQRQQAAYTLQEMASREWGHGS